MIKKYTADSYTEAFLQAKNELGNDCVIVQSRIFTKKSWAGLYQKEMIEITARAPAEKPTPKNAPPRPVLTEEISRRAEGSSGIRGRQTTSSTGEHPVSRPPIAAQPPLPSFPPRRADPPANKGSRPAKPVIPSNAPPPRSNVIPPHTYAPPGISSVARSDSQLRVIESLRTLYEEDEPHSQKLVDDPEESQKMLHLLGKYIDKQHKQLVSDESSPCPPRSSREIPPVLPRRDHKTVSSPSALTQDPECETITPQVIDKKIAELMEMLQRMQKNANQVLQTPSVSCPEGLLKMRERLQAVETPTEMIEEILESLRSQTPFSVTRNPALFLPEARNWFSRHLKFSPETHFKPGCGPRVIALIGPTGVGKTTTIAKLAASFALNPVDRKTVSLFSMDTFRIGATQQLAQYAQIIEIDMEIIMEPGDVISAFDRHKNKDLILIDTAGRSQKNRSDLAEMKELLAPIPGLEKYLVLSATTKFSDMLENVRRFGEVGFDHLVFTKVDETNSIGPLLALLLKSETPLAYITHGQNVPDDFRQAEPEYFFSSLFPETR
ncbi:MAG: flagellar biosynthesis protein FlhF [Candidatus Ozemobacteraceae bacterium]